jgi:hypothetical protein
MFSQSRRLRRFAAHVLLVWLFALGTGIANACVVQLHLQQAGHPVAHDHQHGALAAGQDQNADARANVQSPCHDGANRTPPPCERLCDGPSAVPQTERQAVDLLSGFWLAPAPLPSFDFQVAAAPARIVPGESTAWRRPVPISIAFLRLAL